MSDLQNVPGLNQLLEVPIHGRGRRRLTGVDEIGKRRSLLGLGDDRQDLPFGGREGDLPVGKE